MYEFRERTYCGIYDGIYSNNDGVKLLRGLSSAYILPTSEHQRDSTLQSSRTDLTHCIHSEVITCSVNSAIGAGFKLSFPCFVGSDDYPQPSEAWAQAACRICILRTYFHQVLHTDLTVRLRLIEVCTLGVGPAVLFHRITGDQINYSLPHVYSNLLTVLRADSDGCIDLIDKPIIWPKNADTAVWSK